MNIFIDTSICVDVLRTNGSEKSVELFESLQDRNEGYVSVITVAELSAGAHLSPRADAVEKTEALLAYVDVIELTETIAFEGGKIFTALSNAGKKIEFNDCLIAATARSLGMKQIVTRNSDHFKRIEGVFPVAPEDLEF
jgi:predicted nucleic acid-binding protein